MPVNKNALIRYQTIDRCLRNRSRKWVLQDLTEACTKALYESEGKEQPVSRRTLQLDIQNMRSGKLGYRAPIIVVDRKYYTYEDPEFSIAQIPLNEGELERLSEVAVLLKQFQGLSYFQEIEGLVKKLEDKIEVALKRREPVIHFDQNEQLQGLQLLDPLYRAILNKKVLKVQYQPFWRGEPILFVLHPYILKEYNNRWYVIGFNTSRHKISLLALDRIVSFEQDIRATFIENNFFKPDQYFKEVVGVSVHFDKEPSEVLLYVSKEQKPYILTKPLHASQEVVADYQEGVILRLRVRINFELHKHLLAYAQRVLVISPLELRQNMLNIYEEAQRFNQDEELITALEEHLNLNGNQTSFT